MLTIHSTSTPCPPACPSKRHVFPTPLPPLHPNQHPDNPVLLTPRPSRHMHVSRMTQEPLVTYRGGRRLRRCRERVTSCRHLGEHRPQHTHTHRILSHTWKKKSSKVNLFSPFFFFNIQRPGDLDLLLLPRLDLLISPPRLLDPTFILTASHHGGETER